MECKKRSLSKYVFFFIPSSYIGQTEVILTKNMFILHYD